MRIIPRGPLHPEIAWPSLGVGAVVTVVVVLGARRVNRADAVSPALVASMLASLVVTAPIGHDPWSLVRRMGTSARWTALLAALARGTALGLVERKSAVARCC